MKIFGNYCFELSGSMKVYSVLHDASTQILDPQGAFSSAWKSAIFYNDVLKGHNWTLNPMNCRIGNIADGKRW